MQTVEPLLRLAVLLVAALQGRAELSDRDEAAVAPRHDFSRFFAGPAGGPGPGGGAGLQPNAAASEASDSRGFVEPVDFKAFFGGASTLGGQRQAASPFFGNNAQNRLAAFSSSPFGAVAASSDDGFLQSDFIKSKRGAGGAPSHTTYAKVRVDADAQRESDDFFNFDFPESDTKADFQDEQDQDGENAEQQADEDFDDDDERKAEQAGARHAESQRARYPSYSSYYHTQPEKLRKQADDAGFDDEDGAEDIRKAPAATSTLTSAEAYDSRPFSGGQVGGTDPAKFKLQSGFVPSPIDPLLSPGKGSTGSASNHAAVHAAVAERRGAVQRAALGLGSPSATSFQLTRTRREEPDDAFFESYSDDRDGDQDDKADHTDGTDDDYRFGAEFFNAADDDDEGEHGGQGGRGAQTDDGAEGAESRDSSTKAPRDCKKVKKKGSVCMVCADPDTGGNYEQCQYATEPESQSYSFGRSSSYGSPRPASRRRRRRREEAQSGRRAQARQDRQDARQEEQPGEPGEPLGDLREDSSLEQVQQDGKYEDYFSFLFPELTKEKNAQKKKKKRKSSKKKPELDSEEVSSLLSHLDDEDPFVAETTDGASGVSEDIWLAAPHDALQGDAEPAGERAVEQAVDATGVLPKKDLERMLGEFQQKDRSDCTKVEKDHMTCYQCVDKKGMRHEECMFVAASEPKQSHLAYHQSSAFNKAGAAESEATEPTKTLKATTATKASAKTTTATKSPKSAKSAKVSKVAAQVAAASSTSNSTAPAPGIAKSRQQRAADEKVEVQVEEKDDHDDADDDEKEPVLEEQATAPDGMYSEETKPVFDKTLRMSLPKYMLEKSEHERVFDEVLAAGV